MSVQSINEPGSSVLVSHTPQSINEPSATAPPPDVEGPPIEPPPIEIEEPPVEVTPKHHAVDPDDLEEEIEEAAGTDDFVTLHRGRPTKTLPGKRKK